VIATSINIWGGGSQSTGGNPWVLATSIQIGNPGGHSPTRPKATGGGSDTGHSPTRPMVVTTAWLGGGTGGSDDTGSGSFGPISTAWNGPIGGGGGGHSPTRPKAGGGGDDGSSEDTGSGSFGPLTTAWSGPIGGGGGGHSPTRPKTGGGESNNDRGGPGSHRRGQGDGSGGGSVISGNPGPLASGPGGLGQVGGGFGTSGGLGGGSGGGGPFGGGAGFIGGGGGGLSVNGSIPTGSMGGLGAGGGGYGPFGGNPGYYPPSNTPYSGSRTAPPPRNCFPAGTLVSAQEGLKPIEQVRAGQMVWAFDQASEIWRLCPVVDCYESHYQGDLVVLDIAGEVIESTSSHPFWVIEGQALTERSSAGHGAEFDTHPCVPGRWVIAGELRAGDVLLLRNEKARRIARVARRAVDESVFNLQVGELHCYAVGNCQVLVHNKNALAKAAGPAPLLGEKWIGPGHQQLPPPTGTNPWLEYPKAFGLGLGEGANDMFVQPIYRSGQFAYDVIPTAVDPYYRPHNPYLREYVNGQRGYGSTWLGITGDAAATVFLAEGGYRGVRRFLPTGKPAPALAPRDFANWGEGDAPLGGFEPSAPAPTTPRPGRMHIEPFELSGGGSGQEFVIPGRSVPERFSARLLDGSDTLEIAWTDSLRQTPRRLQEVQRLAGGPNSFSRITGRASAELEAALRSGQFNAQQAAEQLGNSLGGTWQVHVTPIPGTRPPQFNITAVRTGG
jgi:hypothetical protein